MISQIPSHAVLHPSVMPNAPRSRCSKLPPGASPSGTDRASYTTVANVRDGGGPLSVSVSGCRSAVRGSSISSSIVSTGKGVATSCVKPYDELRGTTAIVPAPRANDRGGPGGARDFQGRGTVENLNQFVAGQMALPMILPRGFDSQKEAIAVRSQLRDAALAIRRCRIGGLPEHHQLLASSALRSTTLRVPFAMPCSLTMSTPSHGKRNNWISVIPDFDEQRNVFVTSDRVSNEPAA